MTQPETSAATSAQGGHRPNRFRGASLVGVLPGGLQEIWALDVDSSLMGPV